MQVQPASLDFSMVIASCIHDMKNSLGMLLSHIDDIHAEDEDRMDKLKYQGNCINDHLVQLLVLYRISETNYFPNIDEHPLHSMVLESINNYLPMLDHKHIKVELDCDEDCHWYFDRLLVEGILHNLFNNLYQYARHKIIIRIHQEDNYLRMDIMDDGPGYPEDMVRSLANEQREFCFKSGNTGLGLFFAAAAASLHKNKDRHGYISVSNTGIDNGGCFSLFLP